MKRNRFLLGLMVSIAVAGCVKRTIVVESDPPGASVWINERAVGKTPVTYEFITHGRYRFRLEKTGFRPLVKREMIWAPVYEWIPIDFFAENLIPARLEDKHVFQYRLTSMPAEEKLLPEEGVDLQQALEDVKSPDPEKRRSACAAFARERDPKTAPQILEAAKDPVPKVRAIALAAWRGTQGPESMDLLLGSLRDDPSREVRWQAAVELEALKDRRAIPGLIAALKDRDPLVRTGAAEALKGMPDPQAIQSLIRALRDSDTSVRRAAAEGLGLIGDRAAVRPLTRVLFHHDFQTRRRAVRSLAQLRDPSSGPALVRTFTDWDPQIRRIATEALISFGDKRVIPILIRRLRGLKPWTREHAAQVLGGLKDPSAIEPLKQAFRKESDPPASTAMYEALVAIGAPLDPNWRKILDNRLREAEARKQEQARQQEKAAEDSKGEGKSKGLLGGQY